MIPFKVVKNCPTVNTELLFFKGEETCSISGNFMVDYGYGSSVGIKAATAASRPLACKQEDSNIFSDLRDTVDIQITGITIPNSPILKSLIHGNDFVGVLGVQFLENFDIIIDYINNFLYLKKI